MLKAQCSVLYEAAVQLHFAYSLEPCALSKYSDDICSKLNVQCYMKQQCNFILHIALSLEH
jgi:hypothetical protein